MRRILLDTPAQLDARHARHVHVEERQMRTHGRQRRQGFLRAAEDVDVVAFFDEEPAQDFGDRRLIVHDHQTGRHRSNAEC